MKVLITGAAGRIGRRVISHMAHRDFEVTAVDERPWVAGHSVQLIAAGLVGRPAFIESLLRRTQPDAVIHLAALAGSGCESRPAEAWARNVTLTEDLARCAAAAQVPRFVFASTCAVYHQDRLAPTGETENVAPTTVYGRTKLVAETALTSIAAASTTSFATLRIFNVYGPGMDSSLWDRLRTSTPDDPVDLIGWDHFHRDWLHVDEVARALVLAVLAPGGPGSHDIVNIGSGVARSNADLVAELRRLGVEPAFRRRVEGEQVSYSWADVSRAAEIIAYRPRVGFFLTSR